MATEVHERPPRGLDLLRRDSTPQALAVAALGSFSLFVFFAGVPIALASKGFTPVGNLVTGLESSSLRAILYATCVLGLGASLASLMTYRKMPTKVSRAESVTGGVLGVQAVVLGAS